MILQYCGGEDCNVFVMVKYTYKESCPQCVENSPVIKVQRRKLDTDIISERLDGYPRFLPCC
jgi:hypothetical protein